jgi:hypothetical protein
MNDDEMNEWINHENYDEESINLDGLRFTFHLLYFVIPRFRFPSTEASFYSYG